MREESETAPGGGRCPGCGLLAPPEARYCSRCGQGVDPVQPTRRPKWYFNLWFILLMLFLVAGPFGLPLVWKHPRFSRTLKIILTVAVALYTVGLVGLTVRAAQTAIDQLNTSLQF